MQPVCFCAKNVTCPSSLDGAGGPDAPAGTKRETHLKQTSLLVNKSFHSCMSIHSLLWESLRVLFCIYEYSLVMFTCI